MKKTMMMAVLVAANTLFSGCSEMMPDNKIYPCVTGYGDQRLTTPDGYVYFHNRLMTLDEYNKLTGQHLVIERSGAFVSMH